MAKLSSLTPSLISMNSLGSGGILERLKGNKDEHHTTISAKQNRPLKKNDSTADILAKIYNFMVKKDEDDKLRYELYQDFQNEREEEDQRKHERLMKMINNKSPNDKTGKGFFSGLMSIFDTIATGVGKILGFMKDGLLSVIIGEIGRAHV